MVKRAGLSSLTLFCILGTFGEAAVNVTVHIPLLRRGSERNQATDVCAIAG